MRLAAGAVTIGSYRREEEGRPNLLRVRTAPWPDTLCSTWLAARSGWQVVGTYEDAGISGAKGRDKRPGSDWPLRDATLRKINMVAAWSIDRLGRSLQDLVGFLTHLRELGCDPYLHQQALDTSTPSGRVMFQMCGVFAEFERGMIRERVNAGLARAKERGGAARPSPG
jgi:DNA invertase Pin-like site-specific DNA recombinase